MALWTQYVDPDELTSYARTDLANQPVNRNALRAWLPSQFVNDLDYEYEFGQGGLDEIAMYRAYDATTRVGAMPTLEKRRGELPPISEQVRIGEYDRLRNQVNSDESIRNVILNTTARLARKVEKRLEVARGYALANAAFEVNENRVKRTVSFGRDSSRTATAPTLWSNLATSDWINDLAGWVELMSDENGEMPGAVLTSSRVRRLMLTNAAARAQAPLLQPTSSGTTTRVPESALNGLLAENNIPPIYTYDASYKNASGVKTKIIPDNLVLLLPAPVDPNSPEDTDLGATFWGRTAEALNPDYNLQDIGEEPGLIALTFKDDRPEAVWSYVNAVGMPVVANPNLSFRATVA
jgi:hypothetical protein